MQCGTACLAMMCRHYGYDIGIDEIERLCPSSRDGVSLLAISETATGLGLENATAKMSVDRLSEMPLPCIPFKKGDELLHLILQFCVNFARL